MAKYRKGLEEESRAEQSRAEQSRAEQSRLTENLYYWLSELCSLKRIYLVRIERIGDII